MKRFLRFAVERTIQGEGDTLKEYSIAVAVFDKPDSFDPRLDPIVRVEAGRLRSKLREYYESEGQSDELLIAFPKRSYTPVFSFRRPSPLPPDASRRSVSSAPPSHEQPSARVSPPFGFDSVAVLPFTDLSAKQDQGYFCAGITEEIVNALSRTRGLRVAARTSVMRFRGEAADVRDIGHQLDVAAVLEGSVRVVGKRVRVTAQLINVADGYNLWSDVYERSMDDVFDVQIQISQSIVRALRVGLGDQSAGAALRLGTLDPDAHRFYLQARHHWHKRDVRSLEKALKYYARAAARDPRFALAHAGLAETYVSLSLLGLFTESYWQTAAAAVEVAIQNEPAIAHAHAALGCLRAAYQWNWKEAEQSFLRAVEVDPTHATSHHWYGLYCLAPQGFLERAENEIQLAAELDPVSPAIAANLGLVRHFRSDSEAALAGCYKSLELQSDFYLAHWCAGMIRQLMGMAQEALGDFHSARKLAPRDARVVSGLGYCHAALGQTETAAAHLRNLRRRRSYVSPVDMAYIHLGLGDSDSALTELERAAEIRCSRLIHLKVDPVFQPLRSMPRFGALLKTMGLAW